MTKERSFPNGCCSSYFTAVLLFFRQKFSLAMMIRLLLLLLPFEFRGLNRNVKDFFSTQYRPNQKSHKYTLTIECVLRAEQSTSVYRSPNHEFSFFSLPNQNPFSTTVDFCAHDIHEMYNIDNSLYAMCVCAYVCVCVCI